MALQALLFSKNPETVRSISAILAEAGIRVEGCGDIFNAIEKAKNHGFQCVIVDWVDQPEAGYLVKRARESTVNRETVAMAVVDDEFAAKRAREDQIEFIFHRPIVPDEARSVLGDARHRMKASEGSLNRNLQPAQAESDASIGQADFDHPSLVATAADLPESSQHTYEAAADVGEHSADSAEQEVTGPPGRSFRLSLRRVVVAAILALAIALVWRQRASFIYLVRTPEGGINVLRRSFAALFYANVSGAQSVGSARTEAQQDAYFSRTSSTPVAQSGGVRVVTGEIVIREVSHPLPKAFDFPLPEPELARAPAPAPRRIYARIPDSIRNSAPIPPPTTLPVIPAQLLPISTPPPPIPQVSEPVQLTEEAARALAVRVVDASYPNEARPQKLHGAVVLQALIERDGSVQDVKIVRGYFLLGRAAVTALKQWRFRPYIFNGKPVAVRTQITMNFFYPPA
jgi:TonB family protein